MDCTVNRLPYRQTGYFTKTVLDYIDQTADIKAFMAYPPSFSGIRQSIEARKNFPTPRKTLVQELKKQYASLSLPAKLQTNIENLLSSNTFTVTTAHQNNLFTGPLYFIYKILHAIKLADSLQESFPDAKFVPVFYIGSEDADLQELNNTWVDGQKIVWETKQTGAVGRMKIDRELVKLIGDIEGQLGVLPYGHEIVGLLREYYKEGEELQTATFRFVNALFGEYGLVILLPDNPALKKEMLQVFEDDLFHQTASGVVEKTVEKLQQSDYKVQANPREINLFYLEKNSRERIEKIENEQSGPVWKVLNSDKKFTKEQLRQELKDHPERFSPNVILRGIYQETILPNIVFIGGGGELAYWLQLKELFANYKVPFPVLLARNSFLIVEKKWKEKISRLGFNVEEFFLPEQELLNKLVSRDSKNEVKLNGSLSKMEQLYEDFKKQAGAVDVTLAKHVEALKFKTVQRLHELEKKMLRAEKRKFSDQQRQIRSIREHLFPGNGLQERYDNISYYYAKWGKGFIEQLYNNSLTMEQEFVVLVENG